MKLLPLFAGLLLVVPGRAEPPLDPAPVVSPPAWSAVGVWECRQRDWSGPLTVKEDGTLLNSENARTGWWALSPQGGQVRLILYWDAWPAEIVMMIGPDDFQGNAERGDLHMHRRRAVPPPPLRSPAPSVQTRSWRQGDPPLRLIRKEEGFCALSKITGHFQGGGEAVRVYVGEDGWWYLDGESQQEDVAAECIVVRFAR